MQVDVASAREPGRLEGVRTLAPGLAPLAQPAARLVSLDVFRGITMAGMVIVNNPGTWDAMYWPLEHAEWNGWTPTDLIFPFFLFIVGISLTLSRQTLEASWWRISRRGAVLIACGLFMAGFPFFDPHHWRIPGVLQRIGVCYLGAAALYRYSAERRSRAILLSAVTAAILVAYWVLLTQLGDLSAEGNVGARIDRALMGGHLWKPRWDPEGLLSTVPAIATTLSGVLTGLWLRSRTTAALPPNHRSRSSILSRKVLGLVLCGALALSVGQAWGASFPINKQLWTSSYVLLTSGFAALLLGVCIYVVDLRGFRSWARPFDILGKNALTLFVVSGLIGKLLIVIKVPHGADGSVSLQTVVYERGFEWLASPKNASLIYSLVFLALMFVVCAAMSRRNILLRA